MADSIIGALRVVLGLDTAAFSTGAKQAQSSLDALASSFKNAIAGLSAGVLAEKFTSFVQKAIDSADQLGKASQKFGVPIEQLSGLKFAADLADVSFESLGKGLGKLSKAMLDDVANPTGEAAKSFKALGISVADSSGNLKNTDSVFQAVADKFSTMQDGAAKTAIAIRIFGRAGADLIPLLNAGGDGIRSMQEEAKKLGIVISSDTAAKAEQFNDTIKRIHAATQALGLQIAEALLPSLQKLADMWIASSNQGSLFQSIIKNLITEGDLQQIQTFAQYWENFTRIMGALKSVLAATTFQGIRDALDGLTVAVDTNQKKLQELARSFMSLGAAGAFESMDNLNSQLAKVARGFTTVNMGALAASNAIDNFIKSQQKSQAEAQAQAQTIGAAVGTFEAMKVTMEANAIAAANNIKLTDAQRIALKNLSDQAGQTAVILFGAKLTQEFLSPWDQYLQKIRDTNIALQQHAIDARTAGMNSAKAAATLTETYGQAAATTAGNFANLATAIAGTNKEMFNAAKAFSIAEAIINVLVGVTKAYAQGGVLGLVTGAGVLAAGMATVAKIIAQKPPGAAMGGSFMVPGAGGIDTKMMPIMASPGEKVSIDQNKYGESTGATKTITLQGLKPKEYYRGDVLRDFVDNLNQAIGDGLKIKLA